MHIWTETATGVHSPWRAQQPVYTTAPHRELVVRKFERTLITSSQREICGHCDFFEHGCAARNILRRHGPQKVGSGFFITSHRSRAGLSAAGALVCIPLHVPSHLRKSSHTVRHCVTLHPSPAFLVSVAHLVVELAAIPSCLT